MYKETWNMYIIIIIICYICTYKYYNIYNIIIIIYNIHNYTYILKHVLCTCIILFFFRHLLLRLGESATNSTIKAFSHSTCGHCQDFTHRQIWHGCSSEAIHWRHEEAGMYTCTCIVCGCGVCVCIYIWVCGCICLCVCACIWLMK